MGTLLVFVLILFGGGVEVPSAAADAFGIRIWFLLLIFRGTSGSRGVPRGLV